MEAAPWKLTGQEGGSKASTAWANEEPQGPLKIGMGRWRQSQPGSTLEALPRGTPSNEAWEPFPGLAGARWGCGEPGSVYKYL